MPRLAVFLTVNRGLHDWEKAGTLQREVAVYKSLAEAGWDLDFYTYDRTLRIPEIGFRANVHSQWPYVLPRQLNAVYHRMLPIRFGQRGKETDVVLTNQAHGSGPAVRASEFWKTKLVARCGYVYGEAAEALHLTGKSVRIRIANEKQTFATAELCIVPTSELRNWIVTQYGIPEEKVLVIPNYVDTSIFCPRPAKQPAFDIICVGRLTATKRPHLLLEALKGTGIKIHMIGTGETKQGITRMVNKTKLRVQFTSRVVHGELPVHLNNASLYVNLSKWEGHPKSMIEAMSCGLACIGTNAPGIKNLLTHNETGLLVDSEPRSIADAVEKLLQDANLRTQLGRNAREFALKHFSQDIIFPRYKTALEQIASGVIPSQT